jgi:hypothetical protein
MDPARSPPTPSPRGFLVPEDLERRISACTDSDRIELWAGRLLSARSLDEVFGDELP